MSRRCPRWWRVFFSVVFHLDVSRFFFLFFPSSYPVDFCPPWEKKGKNVSLSKKCCYSPARPPERERGVLLVLDLEEHVEHHRATAEVFVLGRREEKKRLRFERESARGSEGGEEKTARERRGIVASTSRQRSFGKKTQRRAPLLFFLSSRVLKESTSDITKGNRKRKQGLKQGAKRDGQKSMRRVERAPSALVVAVAVVCRESPLLSVLFFFSSLFLTHLLMSTL